MLRECLGLCIFAENTIDDMKDFHLPGWMVLSAAYTLVHSEWNYRDVCSPFARLYYVTEGEGQIIMKTGAVKMRPGYMYIVPAFTTHTNVCPTFLHHYYIHVSENLLGAFPLLTDDYDMPYEIKADILDLMIFKSLVEENPGMSLKDPTPKRYDNGFPLMSMISASCRQPLSVRMLSSGLVSMLMSRFLDKAVKREEVSHLGVAKALMYIRRNPFQKLSTKGLADMALVSSDHFIRLFKACVGVTPQQYIQQLRIRAAQVRLITESTPVKTIAIELGYGDNNYFTRVFRQIVGVSPLRYRRMMADGKL